jgi:large subunit GTPase 1
MLSTGAATIGITEPSETAKMKSILEIDDLSDFLVQAQLANRDFVSEREQFLDVDDVAREYVPTGRIGGAAFIYDEVSAASRSNMDGPNQSFAFHELSVPRRPAWTPGVTTPEELEAMENESFLEWRRGVARREEEIVALSGGGGGVSGASVTPYEKNLHVWRQLWRVLERSSVVLQIVDARNPLFYLSEDLRKYAMEELGKPMLMVVNKSDFLTLRQRKSWSEYFTRKGVDHLFFSAYEEQKKIDDAVSGTKRQTNNKGDEDSIDTDERNVVSDHDEYDSDDGVSSSSLDESAHGSVEGHSELSNEAAVIKCGGPVFHADNGNNSLGSTNLLTREELLDALDTFARSHGCVPDEKYDNNRIQYGMVGFPNGERFRSVIMFHMCLCHNEWLLFLTHALFFIKQLVNRLSSMYSWVARRARTASCAWRSPLSQARRSISKRSYCLTGRT